MAAAPTEQPSEFQHFASPQRELAAFCFPQRKLGTLKQRFPQRKLCCRPLKRSKWSPKFCLHSHVLSRSSSKRRPISRPTTACRHCTVIPCHTSDVCVFLMVVQHVHFSISLHTRLKTIRHVADFKNPTTFVHVPEQN